ncbi:MAG TPA: hypothetical protein VEI02_10370, partial [Planctomycetota bacterium]|nr:hypothetical protein [Planctomycetota bacterium]
AAEAAPRTAAPTDAPPAAAPVAADRFREPETRAVAAPGTVVATVVDEARRPVAGARVEVRAADPSPAERSRPPGPPKHVHVADAAGRVALPTPREDLHLFATDGRASGARRFSRDEATTGVSPTIVVSPDRRAVVVLLDAAGTPIPGVRLVGAEGLGGFADEPWTDARGRADVVVRSGESAAYRANAPEVAAFLPRGPRPKAPLTFDGKVVTLRADASDLVAVAVRVVVAGSAAPPPDLTVGWALEPDAASPQFGGASGFRSRSPADVVFGGFPRGQSVRFWAEAPKHVRVDRVVAMPATGSAAEVTLEIGEPAAFVVRRLVDEAGAPLQGQATYEIHQPAAPKPPAALQHRSVPGARDVVLARGTVELEADGALRVAVLPGFAGFLRVMSRRPDADGAMPAPGAHRTHSETAFPSLAPGQSFDLEPLVWPAPPLFVAGRVLGPDGLPAAGARVDVVAESMSVDGRRRLDPAGRRTDAEGRFALRYEAAPKEAELLKLVATGAVGRSAYRAFEQGATDVELRLEPYGGLIGSVRRRSSDMHGALEVRARQNDGPVDFELDRGLKRVVEIDPETGAFEIRGLRPGAHDVGVFYGGELALSVKGVQVVPGPSVADPRLAGLVVGANFTEPRVTVRGPDGAPVAGAWVRFDGVLASGQTAGMASATTDAAGVATRTFPEPFQRVVVKVAANGFLPKVEENPSFPLELTLSHGAALRLTVALPRDLLAAEAVESWRVTARRLADPKASSGAPHPIFPTTPPSSAVLSRENGTAELRGLIPGDWMVSLEPKLRTPPPADGPPQPSAVAQLGKVVVAGEHDVVEATLAPSPAAEAKLRARVTP